MPRKKLLTEADIATIRTLTLRAAKERFGISQSTWQKIARTTTFQPVRTRAPAITAEVEKTVLESVKAFPHLNTKDRAERLKIRCETCHRILAGVQLSRLEQRLRYAGYQVEVVRPLAVARLRRIVAMRPGAVTHIDYKTFGLLRGPKGASVRLGGYVVVDGFTGWVSVHLHSTTSPRAAIAAIEKHKSATPFDVQGVLFSDNGVTDFIQPQFVEFALKTGFVQRTTRLNHPWSNGKVEAVNRTLKYQCFPVLVTASVHDWQAIEESVDAWIKWYNDTRAHTGHINKGLPPRALYELWRATPGDHFERLVSLGIVRDSAEWQVRRMGAHQAGHFSDRAGVPFALVLERNGRAEFAQQANLGRHVAVTPPPKTDKAPGLVLAR